MAKEKKADATVPHKSGGDVVSMSKCPMEKCGKRSTRAQFCDEHFAWFKEGLISKSGEKPKDFDKKFQAYSARTKRAS